MRVTVDGNEIRIYGSGFGNKVHLKICVSSSEIGDRYSSSLIIGHMEHGCLPSVQTNGEDIIIVNNLEKGRQLYK